MAKTWYQINIISNERSVKEKVEAINAKQAAIIIADKYGFVLTGKAKTLESPTQWHAVNQDGQAVLVRATK